MEALMTRFVTPLVSAFVLAFAAGTSPSFAQEREVNDIWWSLYDHYDGGAAACVAENYNDHPIDAEFEVFPAVYDEDGNPAPRRMVVTLAPYQTYKVYEWDAAAGPGPRCDLRSYGAHVSDGPLTTQ